WYDVQDLAIPSEPGQLDPALVDRATALLSDRLDRYGHFGVKDPRFCVTWPYWRAAVVSLDVEVRAIHAIRRPNDVAVSLARRDGFPLHHGLLLWARYNEGALRHLREYPNIVVDYDDLVDRPGEILESLAEFLEVPLDPESQAIKAYVDDFVDGSLRRSACHQDSPELPPNESLLASVTSAAYELIKPLPQRDDGEADVQRAVATRRLEEALSFEGHYRILLKRSLGELVMLRGALYAERARATQRISEIEEAHRISLEELAVLRERSREELLLRERRIFELDSELEAMHDSLSWRITAPVRSLTSKRRSRRLKR
ncbi:MAG: hypothetical protein ACP5PJ_10080, partial [Acidimicrobiales bacterium]